ncbi:MAG TPA: hypothetical protein DEP05_04790 [Betaproteobacteria bacterium]|nr:hypothetical protein [Betaproteobacteria bacterium]
MKEHKVVDKASNAGADIEPFECPPERSIGYAMHVAYRLLSRDLEEVVGFIGVSRGQWYFLRALWEKDGLTQRELSDRVCTKEPTTVLALKGMEKSKLIYRVRDKDDLRKVRVYLTEAGHGLRNILLPMVEKINERATADISPQALGTFHQVVAQMTEKLRAVEDLEPLVWDPIPASQEPCWKLLPANAHADSDRREAPSNTESGQAGPSRAEKLRHYQQCGVCYASSSGVPRCPTRPA